MEPEPTLRQAYELIPGKVYAIVHMVTFEELDNDHKYLAKFKSKAGQEVVVCMEAMQFEGVSIQEYQ